MSGEWLVDNDDTRRALADLRTRAAVFAHAIATAGGFVLALLALFPITDLNPSWFFVGVSLLSSVFVYALVKDVKHARLASAAYWALAIPFGLSGAWVTERTAMVVFMPALMGFMLGGPRTVLFTALAPLAIMILRGGMYSPYAQPVFLVIYATMTAALVTGDHILTQAIAFAARQMRRLQAITAEANDVIIVKSADSDDRTVFVSSSIERVLGYTAAEFKRLDPADMVHPDDAQILAAGGTSVRALEVRLRKKNGDYLWIDARTSNMHGHPDVRGAVTIFRDISGRRDQHAAYEKLLAHQATHDPLTGLPNRRWLLEKMNDALATARREGHGLGVLFCDLDHFKVVNDSQGHDAGDALLSTLASAMERALGPNDTIARFGGDEFVVLCERITSQADVIMTANRLLSVLHDALDVGQQRLHVTVSMGLSLLRPDHVRGEDMLRDADAAMFHAKSDGRNRVVSFDETMRHRAFRRHELEQALWSAIERNEFQLAFQPKVRITDGTLCGFEALLRWNSVERGPIGPADFIPLAEETGAILPIGVWVLEQACKQLVAWREGHPGIQINVAVNLSGRQLHHQDIVSDVERILKRFAIAPGQLELEITESVVMTNATAAIEKLQQLKALGVRLSIDDFGTGYSSLAYLRKLPVDILKIDRAFVSGLGRDPEDLEICKLVIAMAKMLGMSTVAEGVETTLHMDELRKLGCNTAQGYLIAKPMFAIDAEHMFQQIPTRPPDEMPKPRIRVS